jgi:hypothetical protein
VASAPRNGGDVHVPVASGGRLRRGRGDLPVDGEGREELFFGGGRRFRVIDVVTFDEEDGSLFVGLLQVEPAWTPPFLGG